jgi:hypothetical protein
MFGAAGIGWSSFQADMWDGTPTGSKMTTPCALSAFARANAASSQARSAVVHELTSFACAVR